MKTIYGLTAMRHRKSEEFVASLPAGEPLLLLREPGNAFDANAIQVWARGQHVAFIPKKENGPLAQRMDDLARTHADFKMVGKLVPGQWPQVEIKEPNEQRTGSELKPFDQAADHPDHPQEPADIGREYRSRNRQRKLAEPPDSPVSQSLQTPTGKVDSANEDRNDDIG